MSHLWKPLPQTTEIEWNGRFYVNQIWFNLSDSTKLVLMTVIIQRMTLHRAFQYMDMNADEIQDWLSICAVNDRFEAERKCVIEKAHARGLKRVEAEGDNDKWAAGFYKDLYKQDHIPDRRTYTVTQSEIDQAKRLILCRRQEDTPFRHGLLMRLDDFVGKTFTNFPEIPHVLPDFSHVLEKCA